MLDLSQIKAESFYQLLTTPLPETENYINCDILPKSSKLLFGGTAKLGKSFLGLSLGRALALGTPVFGQPDFTVPKPVRVLILEQEVGVKGLKRRSEAIFNGDDETTLKENLHYLSKVPQFQLNEFGAIDFLDRVVHETGANVLILDPIGKMHGWDENDSQQISKLFFTLDTVIQKCEDLKTSLVISHHYGKPVKDERFNWDKLDPYNFRGSSKWFDDPDSLVTCNRIAKDKGGRVGSRGWILETRFTLRQGEELDDMLFHVNEDDDLRVKFAGYRKDRVVPAREEKKNKRSQFRRQ